MIGKNVKLHRLALFLGGAAALFVVAAIILLVQVGSLVGLVLTPDQQAQRLFDQGRYKEAATLFKDPTRQGVALYRGGEYKQAAVAFARVNTAKGHFNRGNALMMLGKYADAIKTYDRSLQLRPNWKAAIENREIARIRAERTKDEGGDMTGGKLGADKVVIDPGKREKRTKQTEVTLGGRQMSDKELQALWLRRVETKPADFLRAKFAFQLFHTSRDAGTTERQ